MCGIAGQYSLSNNLIPNLEYNLHVMNDLQKHRGPDGEGIWVHGRQSLGFAHCRLSIIDTISGTQPMTDENGNWLIFNGEIYNYLELRRELGESLFRTKSDTEVILTAYKKWGVDCLKHFKGMFAFALWDEGQHQLFCARDRFGIKPFYYFKKKSLLYFSSEIKALIPFSDHIETDLDALKDYLYFQFYFAGKTLFKNINELPPSHYLLIKNGNMTIRRYWDVNFQPDLDHSERYFKNRLTELIEESVSLHLRSDVPVGGYVSGGIDSSVIAALASRQQDDFIGFTGKFSQGPEYDESHYARLLAKEEEFSLLEITITVDDFISNIKKVVYHLDYPIAGPGSFSQFMVSGFAAKQRKVLLGGQGGDEIFGGYIRYLIAYFEQCIKAAIDGTMDSKRFIVSYESIIPNLREIQQYKPLLKGFWSKGLFEPMDRRYFDLINRAPMISNEVRWDSLSKYTPYDSFKSVFNSSNVGKEAYFDLMTHFDFKTLLPALLHVEDRVSMAHGLESRVPLLDHSLIEFAATIPANIKFTNGEPKRIFKKATEKILPPAILKRKDKMGFPTPFAHWVKSDAHEFVKEIFSCQAALSRSYIDNKKVLESITQETEFGRNIWGFLCLEIWHQEFHDKHHYFKKLIR